MVRCFGVHKTGDEPICSDCYQEIIGELTLSQYQHQQCIDEIKRLNDVLGSLELKCDKLLEKIDDMEHELEGEAEIQATIAESEADEKAREEYER